MRFEIHAHSMYSNIRLIDCIIKPKDLILTAYKKGLAGITLTDHEALCGHIDLLNAEKELKESGIIDKNFVCALGNEIYLSNTRGELPYYPHFILIAKNKIGHRALRELSSTAWYNSYFHKRMERVPTTKDELKTIISKYPNSLIASSACLGSEVAHLVRELIELENQKVSEEEIYNKKIEIVSFIDDMKSIFQDDFYLEVAPSKSKDQIVYNKRIKDIAKARNTKLVFGGDAHYLTETDRTVHKAFLNSKEGEREVDDFYQYAYLMDDEEAFRNCGGVFSKEEFDEICANSIEIMNKIEHYNLDNLPIIPTTNIYEYEKKTDNSLSKYPIIFNLLQGTIQERYWVNQCLIKLKEIDKFNDIYLCRLEEEADIIKTVGTKLQNDLFSYFNTFQSYIDLFWECGSIVGPGRGSSVCYLSNYLLGITQLDPLEYDLPSFRFLNKERLELPDIDIDLSPSKRPFIFDKIRERVGETNLLQVATFTTVGSRSAVLTACRGYRGPGAGYIEHGSTRDEIGWATIAKEGIDIDIAQYISSLIPQERGFLWSINDMVYGNEEKGRKPNSTFVNEVNKYPHLLDIMLGIEGLVTTRSQHASGVIIYNNNCCETNALMRSPGGNLTTQFALSQSEQMGDVKFDFLVTEICDKLITTIGLLQQDGYFPQGSLREIYNQFIHPSKLNLNDQRIWDALGNGEVLDVFQFSTQVGLQAATSIKPQNPIEMMMANALTRLVGEKGKERPIDRYVRMKNNIDNWYSEVNEIGLTNEEIKLIEPFYLITSGCPVTQEKLMLMCMKIANFSLKDANKARKIVAKKQIDKVADLKDKFKDGCGSKKLADYVWETCMAPQMSYSFAEPHALSYSFVGIQTLYLATSFPQLYWNCACIISDSGGIYDVWDDDEECETEEENIIKKKKTINYGKIATAIGKTKEAGIEISPPDINKSTFTFSPDLEENTIRYGLSGISKVKDDKVKEIIENRPYSSISDFLLKIKINKPQMVNLIKSGAFDSFGDRVEVMKEYIISISDQKKRVTLQNMKMLIDFCLLPASLEFECKVYNFNKYLKKFKYKEYYILDENAMLFYENNFDMDNIIYEESPMIKQTVWEKIYQSYMDNVRPYVKEHNQELLDSINNRLISEMWNKYCLGSLSKWEMDSVSYYSHPHELANSNLKRYKCVNYFNLPEEPEVERVIRIKDKYVPLYKIVRIAGTVLDKDKNKGIVTLLTTEGVVTVKIFKQVFANYDKQISEIGPDGKKHIIEKSMLARGNKIIVSGIRRGSNFVGKTYARTPWHFLEKIIQINDDGTLVTYSRNEEK